MFLSLLLLSQPISLTLALSVFSLGRATPEARRRRLELRPPARTAGESSAGHCAPPPATCSRHRSTSRRKTPFLPFGSFLVFWPPAKISAAISPETDSVGFVSSSRTSRYIYLDPILSGSKFAIFGFIEFKLDLAKSGR